MAARQIKLEVVVDDKGTVKLINVAREVEKIGHSAKKVKRDVSALGVSFKNLSVYTTGLHSAFLKLSGVLGVLTAGYGFAKLSSSIVSTAASFERLEIMLNNITGSAEEAEKALDFIVDLGARSYGIDAVADAFVKLRTAGIDPTAGSLKALIDALATYGRSSEDLKLAAVAIQQMMAKGVVSMEELRQQLAERIPDAMQIMASELGFTQQEFQKLVSQGVIPAREAIDALIRGLEKKYGGALERFSGTWDVVVARLRTEWQLLERDIAKAGAFETLKNVIALAADELKKLRENTDWSEAVVSGSVAAVSALQTVIEVVGYLRIGFLELKKAIDETFSWFNKERAKEIKKTIENLQKEIQTLEKPPWYRKILHKVAGLDSKERLQLIETYKKKIKELQEKYDSLTGSSVRLRQEKEKIKKEVEETEQRIKKLTEALENLKKKIPDTKTSGISSKPLVRQKTAGSVGTSSGSPILEDVYTEKIKALQRDFKLLTLKDLDRELFLVDEKFQRILEQAQELYQKAPKLFEKTFGSMKEFQTKWAEAWKAEHERIIQEWQKKNDEMAQYWEHTLERMQDTASDIFFDAMRGEIKSLADVWDRVLLWMQRSVADYLGQLFTQKVTAPALSDLFSGITSLFGGLLGGGSTAPTPTGTVNFEGASQFVRLLDRPGLAEGGIVTRPVLRWLGEEGPEAVIPLKNVTNAPPEERTVINYFVINAVDAKSFEDLCRRNPGAILHPVMEDIERNGPVIQTIRRSV